MVTGRPRADDGAMFDLLALAATVPAALVLPAAALALVACGIAVDTAGSCPGAATRGDAPPARRARLAAMAEPSLPGGGR